MVSGKESLWLEGGIAYSQRGWASGILPLRFADQSTPEPAMPAQIRINTCHHYMDVPMRILVPFKGERFRFYLAGGVHTSVLLGVETKTTSWLINGEVTKNSQAVNPAGYATLSLGVSFAGGLNYKVNEVLSLKSELMFFQSLTSLRQYDGIQGYFNSAGLHLGCYYLLK